MTNSGLNDSDPDTQNAVSTTRPQKMDRSRANESQYPFISKFFFLAALSLWLLAPFAYSGTLAQDAIPYLAAGALTTSSPHDVYAARKGNVFDLRPGFRDKWCEFAPPEANCDTQAVAFLSPVPILPITVVLSKLGRTLGTFAIRMSMSLMLAGGMWALWNRLADRTPHSRILMTITAVVLTPMALDTIIVGQTSPVMFLSVCLGLSASSNRRRLGIAASWAGATLVKATPGALVLILIWRRKWRIMGAAIASCLALSVIAAAITPLSAWRDLFRTSLQLNETMLTHYQNGSITAVLTKELLNSQATGIGNFAIRGFCMLFAALICMLGMRHSDDDTRWALGYMALLIVAPLMWWHYNWVIIGALAMVLSRQQRLTDRVLAILPISAVTFAIVAHKAIGGSPIPELQAAALTVLSIFMIALIRSRGSQANAYTILPRSK